MILVLTQRPNTTGLLHAFDEVTKEEMDKGMEREFQEEHATSGQCSAQAITALAN